MYIMLQWAGNGTPQDFLTHQIWQFAWQFNEPSDSMLIGWPYGIQDTQTVLQKCSVLSRRSVTSHYSAFRRWLTDVFRKETTRSHHDRFQSAVLNVAYIPFGVSLWPPYGCVIFTTLHTYTTRTFHVFIPFGAIRYIMKHEQADIASPQLNRITRTEAFDKEYFLSVAF